MTYVQSWWEILQSALLNLWGKVVAFLPEVVGAIIVLVIGLLVAGWLGKLVKWIVEMIKIDQLLEQAKVQEEFKKVNVEFSIAKLLGWIAKWFIIIATLIAVADILKIPQITQFLQEVALYIPQVIAAVVILTIGVVAGNVVKEIVTKSVQASKLSKASAGPIGAVAKWAIIVFALMASLVQLGVAAALIQILFTGLVAMLALAGGLAFGLGGKDRAKNWIERFETELSKEGASAPSTGSASPQSPPSYQG
ncbi:hypothetical protein GF380_01300 [Candidatus Uhrbacteria bacterium]|nr:hypothetical protein [Candidatus Uhrbacteria bacterium]MBD3283920.1 hypothetical protein [Candidatus Uhrbacteria bacterium]